MKNLNLKELFGSTVLAFNHDGRTTVERRSNDGHIRRHLPVGLTKLLSLFILLTLGVGQMWANSTYKFNNGQYIYYQISGNSNWTQATYVPKFNWYWDSGNFNTSTLGTVVPGTSNGYYYATIPNAYTGYIQILRMNGSKTSEQWNYSANFEATSDRTKNCLYFTSASWDNGSMSIKTYAPPMSSVTLSDNETSIVSGSGTSGDPYLVYVGATIKVSASGTKAVPDPDATIYYNFKQSSTSKQNGTGTTYQFTASATANTTYTINLDGYTKVSSTSSTTKAATALYYKTIEVPASSHDITYTTQSTGWTYGMKPASAGESDVVTFVVNPTAGYTVSVTSSDVTLSGPNASNQYTFTMPDNDVAINVSATENKRNITISAGTGGSVNKASASVGVATTTTVTATAQPGYRFTGWTATNCSVASTSSASTTLSGDGTTGDATLVANFARTYAYLEGRMTVYNETRNSETHTASSKGEWDENSTRIAMDYDAENHYFYRHTYKTPAELKAQISSKDQWFSIARSNASGSWSGKTTYHPSSNTDLTTAGSANKKAAQTSTTSYNYKFNSSTTNGYAIIYFDEAGIWYELEHSLIYHANYAASGTSGTAPATEYYPNGFAATAAEKGDLTMMNYTFSGWNTDEHITGTSYAVGSSITMNANKDLYAVWKRSIPMDDQDATTRVSNTVYGTYNCTTLSEYTNPEKTGYTFNGWYTQEAGGGNYVISPEKELQPGVCHWTNYDNNTNEFMRSPTSTSSLYAKWTQTVTLNANLANHGSGDNTSATIVYKATDKSSITHCTPAPGYHLVGYYTAATDGVKVLNADGSFAGTSVTDYITDSKWTKAGATTLYAHYEPNTYDVILDVNGATTGSNQTVTATFDADMPTTQKGGSTPISAPSKTGYTFGGYWTNAAGTGTQYYTSGLASNHVWDVATNNTKIYAKWTPNNYTVTLNINEANHGTIAGKATSASVTFDATPTAITAGQLPTAAQGYAFMGFFTAAGGEGVQVINANGTWIASVTGYTDASGNWVRDGGITLYAYYKKAEITALALSAGTVLPGGSVTATATVAPNPTGDTHIDWKLLYNNGTEYSPQPSEFSSTAQSVEFPAPTASGTYKVQAQLRTGSVGGSGTLLSERTTSFVVAGTHTVTIQYKCGDQVIKTATTREGVMPLTWSESITAPNDIFGYTFDHWEAGDGVTISTNGSSAIDGTTTTTADIYIKAIYDGRLTAVYTKKNIIYFKNTLGWSDVYAHFLGSSYWDTSNGTGNNGRTDRNKQMTRLGETDIWYFDYGAVDITPNDYLVFTDRSYNNWSAFNEPDISTKPAAPVVYPIIRDNTEKNGQGYGFNAGTPMFVPVTQDGIKKCDNKAIYFNNGYWRAYDPTTGESGSTGYTLKIYDKTSSDGRNLLQSIPFANADASGQIFKASINLEAAKEYGIKVERDNSLMYTNIDGHLHRTGEVVAMSVNPDDYKAIYILTTAAGDYDFIITCNGSGQLCLQATFPAAKNDYRVLYTDNATWSNTAHTARAWVHPSRVISAKAGATDTISFFVSEGNSPEYKIQKVSSINEGTGAITWTDVTSWTSISVDKTGVYNFIFNQPSAGSISRSKTEAYTGNYYIRTDNAGSTKWENYREEDHKMTYSEYAAKITHTGEEWKDFTHYFMKFVDKDKESGKYKNVNFTVANDYSPCISDTLVQQAGDVSVYPSYTHVDRNGDLQENANIRFMWNSKNNKLQRAYLAAAQTDGSKFLVLQGQSGKLLAPDGTPLSDANGNNHRGGTDAIQFTDKEHWMYEAEVKAVPGGRVKLYATYNSNTFYYYGDNTASFTGASAIDLVTGDGGEAQTIRVVYDFKTDRLIAAWVPSEETIENEKTVNADIMLIREHQGQGHQINLKGSGSIKTNKTVYGVLRFNRWTLNNKSTAAGHAVLPVDEQKSQYERFNYMISFPFDVKVGEIFGFGTIGRHYRIFYYDGLGRAQEGFFAERGDDNWRMIDDTDSILHANQGYLLQLNSIRMKDDNTETWPQANLNEVELYFPAMNTINTISLADVTIPALGDAYKCKINLKPTYEAQENPKADEADRRVKDSYWRCIGVPGFTSYEFNADTSVNFNWKAETEELPYLYEWHMDDNKLSVVSSSTFTFKPMHAYLIQNGNSFTWRSVAVPSASSVVARRQAPASEDSYYEFYLEMSKDEEALDHTYVRLTNNESVTTDFDFGQDLSKELNSGANIYTQVGYERLAANNLPLNNQTTIVPVGVKITEEGEYTFAMPEGTNGTGVTLIDNETGTRTSLALTDYTVTLGKGTYDNRFVLEFSPVAQTPTGIEDAETVNRKSSNRKLLIDGILYIVKDGQVFDARGTKVK